MTKSSAKPRRTDEEYLTIPEMIALIKVSRSTFYYWRQTGKAPRGRKLPNGEIRVERVVFDDWFANLEEAA